MGLLIHRVYLQIGLHSINGSPINCGGHKQNGLWLCILHTAFIPHVFVHGSIHFWLRQASCKLHSELTRHSGLQCGGLPTELGKHVQIAESLTWRQCELGPQGAS